MALRHLAENANVLVPLVKERQIKRLKASGIFVIMSAVRRTYGSFWTRVLSVRTATRRRI